MPFCVTLVTHTRLDIKGVRLTQRPYPMLRGLRP